MARKCLICGKSEDEVLKLFCFPKNLDRSRLWQERLGCLYQGSMARSHRICSNHFSSDSFVPCKNVLTLKIDAVPKPFTVQNIANVDAEQPLVESATPPPTPSTAACTDFEQNLYLPCSTMPHTPHVRVPHVRPSLFKSIEGLCFTDSSPRRIKLMSMVRRREDHIKKLKKTCRACSRQMKELGDVQTFPQYKSIFKGMSQTIF